MSVVKKIEAPQKVSDWVGKIVRSKIPVENSLGRMPAGTLYIIESSGAKKKLVSLPCECCGFKFSFYTKKSKEDFLKEFDFVELVEEHSTGKAIVDVDESVLFFAFLHAIGRNDTVALSVVENVARNWSFLSPTIRGWMEEEIRKRVQENGKSGAHDYAIWEKLLKINEEEKGE